VKLVNSVAELQEILSATKKNVVLVPTMGALHEGHLSLVKLATSQENPFVVVSIFVNPTQFGKNEDFDKYPRTLEADLEQLKSVEVLPDVVFAPNTAEVYPTGLPERLEPRAGAVGSVFEGVARPGHFDGMLHVVNWFFRTVNPKIAIFGAKDAQQLYLIRRMVHREFADSITIIEGPTVRAASGLALSSRNRFLSEMGQATAPIIYANLKSVEVEILLGEKPSIALAKARAALEALPLAKLDYLALVDKSSFKPIDDSFQGEVILLVAIVYEGVRLIDNITFTIQEPA